MDDPKFKDINDISDVPSHILDEIAEFFKTYKNLEGKKVEVLNWDNAEMAKKEAIRSIELYKEKY